MERDALREHTIAQHRELVELRQRLAALQESYGHLNEALMIERRENATRSGVIARAQRDSYAWPAMPTHTMARIMGGPHGWIDVPIVQGDTVMILAKCMAAAMAQHERTGR